jgi:hypothetical protein
MISVDEEDSQEDMAFPVGIIKNDLGISLLSQIIRMIPPKDMIDLHSSFLNIMYHLAHKKNWYSVVISGI